MIVLNYIRNWLVVFSKNQLSKSRLFGITFSFSPHVIPHLGTFLRCTGIALHIIIRTVVNILCVLKYVTTQCETRVHLQSNHTRSHAIISYSEIYDITLNVKRVLYSFIFIFFFCNL